MNQMNHVFAFIPTGASIVIEGYGDVRRLRFMGGSCGYENQCRFAVFVVRRGGRLTLKNIQVEVGIDSPHTGKHALAVCEGCEYGGDEDGKVILENVEVRTLCDSNSEAHLVFPAPYSDWFQPLGIREDSDW